MTRLLLVGGGHAHAQVLRHWAQAPLPGVALVVVSPTALAPYSGMVPGWLAGRCDTAAICLDIRALTRAAGGQFIKGELQALSADGHQVQLTDGRTLGCDWLSLNVGATLAPPPGLAAPVLALRPLATLLAAWPAQLAALRARPAGQPLHIAAVGGGAAGVESLLAVLARLRADQPGRPLAGTLASRSTVLLPGLAAGAARCASAALQAAGVRLCLGCDGLPSGGPAPDLVLWATGAQAHAWQRDAQRRGGLAVDEAGFLRIGADLRSISHPQVFAVGDCAAWAPPLPKAGVYAVRMGPVLAHNLRAALTGAALQPYRPQRHALALLATGDGRAIAARGRWWAEGRWLGRWKDHIDRRFVRGFAVARAEAPGAP
jgi:pyridine nucleotide-disulfide oxidoreductase family protein